MVQGHGWTSGFQHRMGNKGENGNYDSPRSFKECLSKHSWSHKHHIECSKEGKFLKFYGGMRTGYKTKGVKELWQILFY